MCGDVVGLYLSNAGDASVTAWEAKATPRRRCLQFILARPPPRLRLLAFIVEFIKKRPLEFCEISSAVSATRLRFNLHIYFI